MEKVELCHKDSKESQCEEWKKWNCVSETGEKVSVKNGESGKSVSETGE
jgi:hypothetical protein